MHNNKIGFISGFVGGVSKFILEAGPITDRMMEACFTALMCGVLGMAGKDIYVLVKSLFKKRKRI